MRGMMGMKKVVYAGGRVTGLGSIGCNNGLDVNIKSDGRY